ncbi:MAG: DUF935 family protein [Burkholderiaceae bacterium]|nr:MAG: DUF935 family protein [Burkholderiaceae bacterium]
MGVLQSNDPLIIERGLNGSQAHELYRDLRRDGKVFAGLQKRKLAVVSRPWTVEPVSDDAAGNADAAVVSDILKGFAFDQLCNDLMDALLVGWQPAEIIWTLAPVAGARERVVPRRVVKRAHRRFVYLQEAGQPAALRLLTREHMQQGIALPERKFIVHRVNAEDDNPYGTGLGLQLYWPVYFKRKGVLAWTKFLDRFGLPIPWGKYPTSATPREKGTLFDALRAVSNDGMIMTPEGTMIELLESKLSGSGTPHQAHVEFMDDWIMEVILGQSPRGGSGGALAAAANERQDVRLELSQADSDLLSETLNATLVKWICELNGLAPCTVYRKVEAEEDTKATSESDLNVTQMGFQMTEEAVRAKYGEGWEKSANPPSAGANPANSFHTNLTIPASGSSNFAEAPHAHASTDQVALDDALDKMLADDALQQQMEQVLAPVFEQLQKENDPQAMLGWLAERFPDLPEDALQERLSQVLFAAAVWGRLHGKA